MEVSDREQSSGDEQILFEDGSTSGLDTSRTV